MEIKIPTLTEDQMASWKYFSNFSIDELYAIIDKPPAYGEPHKTEDSLGFNLKFDFTKKIIKNGKAKTEKIISQIKDDLCSKWATIKEQNSDKITDVAIIALIVEVIISCYRLDTWIPVTAVAELIRRASGYSLDKLCGPSE